MHPFRKYCFDNDVYMRDLATELNIDGATLWRIANGLGALRTRIIIDWCRRNYIDPWDVFCAPAQKTEDAGEDVCEPSLRNRPRPRRSA